MDLKAVFFIRTVAFSGQTNRHLSVTTIDIIFTAVDIKLTNPFIYRDYTCVRLVF